MRKTNLSEYQCILELSNEKIALGTIDGHIFIYDLDILSETYIKFVNKVSAHKLSVNCLVELTDSRLASCSSDSFIKIWNIKINDITLIKELQGGSTWIERLIPFPNNTFGSWSPKEKTIHIWSAENDYCPIFHYTENKCLWKFLQLKHKNIFHLFPEMSSVCDQNYHYQCNCNNPVYNLKGLVQKCLLSYTVNETNIENTIKIANQIFLLLPSELDLFDIIQDDSVTNISQLFSLIYIRFNKDYLPIIEFLRQQEIQEKVQEVIMNKTLLNSFIKAIITDINQNIFSFEKDSQKSLTDLVLEKFAACKNKLNEKLFPTFLNCLKINPTLITNVFLRNKINIKQTVFQDFIENYIQRTKSSNPNQIFTNVFFIIDLAKKVKLYKHHLYFFSKLIMLSTKLYPQNYEAQFKTNNSQEIFLVIII